MTQEEFWQLIDKTRDESGDNPTKQAELLTKALTAMPVEDILDYQRLQDKLEDLTFRTDVWDVAYIMGEGCGDDGFKDFRAWLIGQGKTVFENALKNPDSLANVAAVETRYETQAEDLLYVAAIAYEKKTNTENWIPVKHTPVALQRNSPCFSLDGKDQDTCLEKHYPDTWSKFGWNAD